MLLLNTGGYDLFEEKENWFVHIKDGPIYGGPFYKVTVYMIKRLGFKLPNIEEAITEMLKNDHNCAHFGINGTLIYTYNKEPKNLKKVG